MRKQPPTPQKGQGLTGVSQGAGTGGRRGLTSSQPLSPRARIPSTTPGRAVGGGGGGRRLHPARVRQEGPSGKEGTPPPLPRPHLGSAGGRGGPAGAWLQRVWATSPRAPPPAPRGGRQMGRPPAQRRRQETAAGPTRTPPRAGGGARAGHAPWGGLRGPRYPWEPPSLASVTTERVSLDKALSVPVSLPVKRG